MRLKRKAKIGDTLTEADRRQLLRLYLDSEIAAKQSQIANLWLDDEFDRITREYGIDHSTQSVNIATGEITKKEEA